MKKGFTLLEILVSIAIFAVITVAVGVSISGTRRKDDLNGTTAQIASLLRQAQSDSLAQSQGSVWGIHFDDTTPASPFYEIFYVVNGGTYASSTKVGRYPLPADLCFATSSVSIFSSTTIFFSGISGAPSAATNITLQLMTGGGCPTATSSGVAGSVTRSSSGEIFFDDFNRANL